MSRRFAVRCGIRSTRELVNRVLETRDSAVTSGLLISRHSSQAGFLRPWRYRELTGNVEGHQAKEDCDQTNIIVVDKSLGFRIK